MHWIDWFIILALVLFLMLIAVYTKRFTRGVADFLAANRCAGRYVLSVASVAGGIGSITLLGMFQIYYTVGFTAVWWDFFIVVVTSVVYMSGWVYYRFRQTKALTLAQFLEMRYSRKFRIFSGILAWISGIINFGIFPSVGARFLIHFCGLPDTVLVYALVMMILLGIALFFAFIGGMISILVTDFVQGMFCNIAFVVITLFIVLSFNWSDIGDTLIKAPEQASLVNPFHTANTQDFNIAYYLIIAFTTLYTCGVWQGAQGFKSAGLNAHEARMGNLLVTWRLLPMTLFAIVVAVFAYVFMHSSVYAIQAKQALNTINSIHNSTIRDQMVTPIAAKFFLPTGTIGLMGALMLASSISSFSTYLHSWGSIFVQDVVMPFRKKPFTPKQHLILLKLSILLVAVFAFTFSLVFRQTEYIVMFLLITGVIFTGGAGAVVVGGLYWKRGTTAGAWSALITGGVLATVCIILRQIHFNHPFQNLFLSYIASKNLAVLGFYTSLFSVAAYCTVSLIWKKHFFDLDELLHRKSFDKELSGNCQNAVKTHWYQAIVGLTDEFNTRDKLIYFSTIGWNALLMIVFVLGTLYNVIAEVSDKRWLAFWHIYIWVLLISSVITTVWFLVCGAMDINKMFRRLMASKRDDSDDGWVFSDDRTSSKSQSLISAGEVNKE